MNDTAKVMNAMLTYYAGDVRRVNHFLKVYGFAKAIGEMEGLPEREQSILEIAALTHDIGIKNSEAKYNSAAGHYQELEGPPAAREMLESLGLDTPLIDRVCWLIGHHHTYGDIKEDDHLILIEADFLVNACEDGMAESSIINVRDKIFRTATGKRYLDTLYIKK
jgi:HD superfamily phosphodiesterase